MKLRDIFVYFIIALAMAVGAYQDHQLHQEIKNKPTIVVEEYILPAPKEKVEAVIAQYYEEVAKASIKDEKSSPNVKIKPKKVIQRRIDIKSKKIINEIAEYIKVKEGFSATAYKDHGQYSIGYGTAAKSPNEKITIEEATVRLYHHIETIIIPSLQNVNFQSIEQVHSAIDFSYNLGHNTFKKNIILALLDNAYEIETLEDGTEREVMRFKPEIAPFKVGVMPLIKKLHAEKAHEVYRILAKKFRVIFDETGSIGKRYRRQDAIGTPFCVTVDDETISNGTVSIG